MIDVGRDAEGMRQAFEELFEEDFARRRITRDSTGAGDETKARLEESVRVKAPRTLSPGYYTLAHHILELDAEREAALALDPQRIAAFEAICLISLADARAAFRTRHPPCSACGTLQDAQFTAQCSACGVKLRRKGA